MTTKTSLVNLITNITSRNQAKDLAKTIADAVNEGHFDALPLWINLKGMEEMIKDVKEQTRDTAIREIEKHGKSHTMGGTMLSLNSGKRIFEYKHNPEWQLLMNQIKGLEEQMKLAINHTIVDPMTGEVIPAAKVKHTTETISVTLA